MIGDAVWFTYRRRHAHGTVVEVLPRRRVRVEFTFRYGGTTRFPEGRYADLSTVLSLDDPHVHLAASTLDGKG